MLLIKIARSKVSEDWKKGHLVKLPKKGDLSSCDNWKGIMLLFVPGKVSTRIHLVKLKTILREDQASFRQNRSYADQITTLRIIIEQTL
ncbi:hypothetical protein ElyMa_003740300 [Elysia marginata]|uniref:Reverse transcriptase domain-containing protein n=1 Tax=Elysia marginata TaxID=1093978 RepID=A0AAV4F7M6_9GAST|nr:hypothetical protein ElyMa_003740300 [Elysia marginata]